MAPDVQISNLGATSVSVSWTQPPITLGAERYDVHINLTDTQCQGFTAISRNISTTGTSIMCDNLEENSTYVIGVTAVQSQFGDEVRVVFISTREAGRSTNLGQ